MVVRKHALYLQEKTENIMAMTVLTDTEIPAGSKAQIYYIENENTVSLVMVDDPAELDYYENFSKTMKPGHRIMCGENHNTLVVRLK